MPINRRTDRLGPDHDWDSCRRNAAIESRILVAAPGGEISLRKGTDDLMWDKIRNITWADVMQILCEEGVIGRCEENVDTEFWKNMEACGNRESTRHSEDPFYDVRSVVNQHLKCKSNALDFTQDEDLREFLSQTLSEEMRKSHFDDGAPDCTHLLEELVTAAFEFIRRIGPISTGNFTNSISMLGNDLSCVLQRHKIEDSQNYAYEWRVVLQKFYNHPSNKKMLASEKA